MLSLGSLLHLKGFWLGIEAFARFERDNPESEFWLIGGGPERGRLEVLARKLGVAAKVRFFGSMPRSMVLEKLAECDALVHPSLHDSGGWVCLEAMAAGLPVVCLDLGGPGVEVTVETGIKIPAISPDQAVAGLAEAFRTLAADPHLRARFGAAGRRRVAEHFTWEKKSAHMLDIYESLRKDALARGTTQDSRTHIDSQSCAC